MARAGEVEHEVNYEPRLQNPPLPPARRQVCSTSFSTTTSHLSPAPGQTGCLLSLCRRSGCSGTPWSRWETSCRWCQFSLLLCRCWGAARWAARSGAGSRSHLQFVCGLAASWPRASTVTSLGWRRSAKGQPSRWHVGGASLCGVVSRSRVRRSSPWRRFCLTSDEGPPPDQGGKQRLVDVLGQVLVPQIQEQIVAVVVPAVDVPVTTQRKFQESLQYVSVKVPQIQFIVRLCEHSVAHRDGYSQCKLCRNRRIPQVQFLDVVVLPVVR